MVTTLEKLTVKHMQIIFAFIVGFALTLAFGCGDNVKPPNIDSFTFDNFDQFPNWPPLECPLPPPEQMEEECRFNCVPTGNHWKCTEICESEE